VSKARQIVVAIDVKHVAQQKYHVPNGSLVGRHIVLRASAFDLFGPARAGGRVGRYSVAVLRQRRIAVESEEVIARGGCKMHWQARCRADSERTASEDASPRGCAPRALSHQPHRESFSASAPPRLREVFGRTRCE